MSSQEYLMYIRSRRVYKGLSQEKIAKEFSLTALSYRNKEIGKTKFTKPEMYMLRNLIEIEDDKWQGCLSLCK